MQIENVFEIDASPDRVYGFLLDVERIVGCVPGAELVETIDENTFKGKVKIKVGPITVSYTGTAEITDRDEQEHRAVLKANGREAAGSGSARATATMTVVPKEAGSQVTITTDFTVAGRIANFGRGVMEDVSKRLIGQMADCIKANLELEDTWQAEQGASAEAPAPAPAPSSEPSPGPAPSPEPSPGPAPDAGATAPAAEAAAPPDTEPPPPAEPVTPPPAPPSTETPPTTPPSPPPPAPPGTSAAATAATPPAPAATADAAPATPPAPRPRPPQVTVQAKPVGAFSLFFGILGDRLKRLFGGSRS